MSVRRLLAALVALVALLAVTLPAQAAPRVTSPTATQVQVQADPPVAHVPTRTCTESVMTHDFANSYYAPYVGRYTPPHLCTGPWNQVVLTVTSSVGGTQFDRLYDVTLGGAELMHGSTSEPCCSGSNRVQWTATRVVTQYASLLTKPEPVLVQLDNVNDATYTGVYHVVATLTFSQASAAYPAPATPDVVLPITQVDRETASPKTANEPNFDVGAGQTADRTVTFPRTTDRITAELFADGHGPCEEFWYTDPSNCAGTPYREVGVSIDGVLAGIAPVYPVAFTGLDGPGLWEPIPSPRAWNLRPYDVDLTPFVGAVVDGRPHTVSISILDATFTDGDYWIVSSNLLVSEQHRTTITMATRPTGGGPLTPTDDASTTPGGGTYSDTASHALSWTGTAFGDHGTVTTTVTNTAGEQATEVGLADDATWSWDEKVTSVVGGVSTVDDTDLGYSTVNNGPAAFRFGDSGTHTVTVGGKETFQSTFTEEMTTAGPSGLASNGVETETYGAADTRGLCYDRTLASQAGEVTVDRRDASCPAVTPTG